MKSAKRGDHEVYNAVDFAGKPLVFLRRKDNGEITTGYNCNGVNPVGSVRRWSKTERKIVDLPAPAMVLQYSSSMGGTGVMDHAFSCNRPGIRSKKVVVSSIDFLSSIFPLQFLFDISENT